MYFFFRFRQTRDLGHRFDCDWNSCPCAPCDNRCLDSKYSKFVVSLVSYS